jgi:hypothetical protein
VKLAPFGVTTLNFGISCSPDLTSVLVWDGSPPPLSYATSPFTRQDEVRLQSPVASLFEKRRLQPDFGRPS